MIPFYYIFGKTPPPTTLYVYELYISEEKQKAFFSSNVNIEAEGTHYKYT